METRAHHIVIGFFTLVVSTAALLFGLWLANKGNDNQYSQFDILFQEPVSGLSKGSTAEFNGIKIGEVTSLRLDENDPRRVYARIRVDNHAPVRTDTKAGIVPVGITGTVLIRLTSGDDPSSQRLQSQHGEIPVIVATPSPLSRLMANGEDLLSKTTNLLDRSNAVLSDQNLASFSNTLKHIEETTQTASAERENLKQMLSDFNKAIKQANQAFASMNTLMQGSNTVVQSKFAPTLDAAQKSVATLESALKNVDAAVTENRGSIQRGAQGLEGVGPALEQAHKTMQQLQGLSRKLEENPSELLLGTDKAKEFTP